jgi:hypothetical protein
VRSRCTTKTNWSLQKLNVAGRDWPSWRDSFFFWKLEPLKGTGSGSLKEEKRRHLSLISWTQCNKFATTGTYMPQDWCWGYGSGGTGSVGSLCFCYSRIRIRIRYLQVLNPYPGILLHPDPDPESETNPDPDEDNDFLNKILKNVHLKIYFIKNHHLSILKPRQRTWGSSSKIFPVLRIRIRCLFYPWIAWI